jgi:hypothetical protein
MRTRICRWLGGLIVFGLLMSMAISVGATPSAPTDTQEPAHRNGQWLSFDGTAVPSEPVLSLLGSDAKAIDLQATLPGSQVAHVRVQGQNFTRLFQEGYGHPSQIGLPDLPVLRQGVEIPFGAQVSLEVLRATYADYSLSELSLYPIYPLQPPAPKLLNSQENPPFEIDQDFYANGSLYPQASLTLGEEYIVRGHRIQPVEVWPVAYDPSAGTLRIYSELIFRLRLTGSDMVYTRAQAERYASPAFESRLSHQFLNYNQGQPVIEFAPDASDGYLIVTADAYYDAMQPFVTLKESRGFDVTMTRISDIPGGGSNVDIKAYIQDAYDNWPTPPSYVLLVGDTDTLPGWDSVSASEITDLYYATMDGADDWHPDIGRGRFPVRSAAQTTIMVDKSLTYANFTGDEPWLKKAAFIASCDDWQTAEGTHNYVIQNYTEPNGYTGIFPNNPEPGGDRIYCVTYNGSAVNITNAANDGRWVIIYSGHGSPSGWGDGQVSYSQSDVINLTDYGFYPFVASHACNTGDFEVTEAYCETWVLQEGKGALVFWGSSDSSFWDEDDILERAMFDSLFAEVKTHADVTQMTYYGLAETEAAYPGSARYYWETYNVMGDPGVKVFIEPDMPTFSLMVEPAEHEICGSGSVTSAVQIGSILGYSETVYLETDLLPAGITATFDPISAQAPFTSELTLDVAPGTPTGDYQITITATDYTSWTLDTSVALGVDDAAPSAPALSSPPDGAVDVPHADTLFQWSAIPEARSYRLQVDDDPAFGSPDFDVTGITTNTYALAGPLELLTTYYWRVSGSNGCGEGTFSDAFSFTVRDLPCILLVDDDNDSPDVRPYYTAALDSLGYEYDVYDVGGGSGDGPSQAEVLGYEMILWFSGDKYSGSAGPNRTDEINLVAYLDGGGKLFLSSQDYLFDFGLTTFGSDYLGIGTYSNDSGNASTKYGVSGDPIGDGLGPYSLSYPAGFDDYGDIVNAGAGASVAFTSSAGGGNNLDVDKDGGDWRTVFFGTSWVPIHNSSAADGEEVLQRIVDWFGGCECVPVSDTEFDWTPPVPVAGENVSFTGTASGTLPISFTWDFGDGDLGEGQVVAHTYDEADVYTVVMTATNCETSWATATHTIVIGEPAPEFYIYLPLVLRNSDS